MMFSYKCTYPCVSNKNVPSSYPTFPDYQIIKKKKKKDFILYVQIYHNIHTKKVSPWGFWIHVPKVSNFTSVQYWNNVKI